MSNVVLECTALKGTDKKGVLKPTEDGYFTVILGAYDIENNVGRFYTASSARRFLEPGGIIDRKIKKGVLYGEIGHPSTDGFFLPNGRVNMPAWIQRLRQVREDRHAFHIRRIYLEDRVSKDGKRYVAVVGEIRPQGPYAQTVLDALTNPDCDAHFSVRSLAKDDRFSANRETTELITWDYVGEGGIEVAKKYGSPGLESFDQMVVEANHLWEAKVLEEAAESVGIEHYGSDLDDVIEACGWGTKAKKSAKPAFFKW